MKELIIIVGTIMLGCMIFNMIAGDEDSLRATCGAKMEDMMELYHE